MSRSQLGKIIEKKILKYGPINFYDYMKIWLYGTKDETGKFFPGFYTGNNLKIGDGEKQLDDQHVDFYTTPEYSFLFGNLLAKKITQLWKILGKPSNFSIIEMGAGNGTMAYDILTGLQYFLTQKQQNNFCYTIVEKSPTLLEIQQEKLKNFKVDFIHLSATEQINKNIVGVFISNELPDAFPVHIIRKSAIKNVLEELYIEMGDSTYFSTTWGELSDESKEFLQHYEPKTNIDIPYCFNTDALKWLTNMSKALSKGFIITIDYSCKKAPLPQIYLAPSKRMGSANLNKDYLSKEYVGTVDITTGLDFEMLMDFGKKYNLKVFDYDSQPRFISSIASTKEIEKLKKHAMHAKSNQRDLHGFVLDDLWDVLIQEKI